MLRPFHRGDISGEYLQWLNDPVVVRLSNQRFRKHDEATSLAYLESFSGTDNLFMSIRETRSGRAVGTLTAYIAAAHGTADLGIMLGDRGVWGRGLGQDAWNTACTWLLGDKGIRKLTAGTLDCNDGMLKIMQRSGMHLEAVRRAHELVDGQPHDIHLYARFRIG